MRRPLLATLLVSILLGGGSALGQEPIPDRLRPAAWLRDDLATRLRQRMHLTRSEPAFASGIGDSGPAQPVGRGPAGVGAKLATGSPALTFVALITLSALIFVAVVVYLLRTAERSERPPPKKRRVRHDYMKDGDAALARSDCDGALRAFYRHGVDALLTSGIIPAAEHLSDALIARRLEDQLRAPFAWLSHQFQPMRYGAREVSAETAQDARAAAIDIARLAFRAEPEADHGSA